METREERKRENCVAERDLLRGERKENKIRKKNYSICVLTVSYLRWYCSDVPNFLTFGTPHEGLFLLFGVPNAKYLAFGTPDDSALRFWKQF